MPAATAFPFGQALSLKPLADYWRDVASGDPSPLQDMAAHIVARLDAEPALLEPLSGPTDLDGHRDLVDLMMTAIFPKALHENTYAAAFAPFEMQTIFSTPAFDRLMKGEFVQEDEPMDEEAFMLGKAMQAYHFILRHYYDVPTTFDLPLTFRTQGRSTGLDRYFRINIDPQFCSILPIGEPKQLSEEEIERLIAEPMNLALWRETLPPDGFAFHGLVVMTAIDVTDQEVLSLLKRDLLQQDAMATPERIDLLERRLRMILRCPKLRLGLMQFERNDEDAIIDAAAVGRSLLLGDEGMPTCTTKEASAYAKALATRDLIAISDLAHSDFDTGFEQHLRAQGFRSLLLAPLTSKGKLIGLLELATPTPGVLNTLNALKLNEVVALFTTALRRSVDEREDRLQAIIKRQYTALHPVVEWRFREAAARYLQRQDKDPHAQLDPIIFRNVFPLYGLTDVRDSSSQRNAAIQADLLEQLGLALAIIVEASMARPLPALDEIGFRLEKLANEIESGLTSEHESGAIDFLHNDFEPLLDHLRSFGESVAERIDAYQGSLDPRLGILYRQHRDFDESIERLNDTVAAYLDEQQEHAQSMYPHYFARYKTDGVDYSIYVGGALLEDGHFDDLYLRNLRLWQLMVTCGIARKVEALTPRLKLPLQATHLILVQHAPLSIHFRHDEKQFDVEGAYNIRYEIVKKRIDKATVHDGAERLTQPGKIAIVYSQRREVVEYYRFIEYLQAAGYLTDEIEELELDPLQGVTGLKALRVTVATLDEEAGDGAASPRVLEEIATFARTAAPA